MTPKNATRIPDVIQMSAGVGAVTPGSPVQCSHARTPHDVYFQPSGTIGEIDMALITKSCRPWHCNWDSGSCMKTGADEAAANVSIICTHVIRLLTVDPRGTSFGIEGMALLKRAIRPSPSEN